MIELFDEDLFTAWAMEIGLEPVVAWMYNNTKTATLVNCLYELGFTEAVGLKVASGNQMAYIYGVMPRDCINVAREIKGITCVARVIGCYNPY